MEQWSFKKKCFWDLLNFRYIIQNSNLKETLISSRSNWPRGSKRRQALKIKWVHSWSWPWEGLIDIPEVAGFYLKFFVWLGFPNKIQIIESGTRDGWQHPKSFYQSHEVDCFYETESEVWAGLDRFGSLLFDNLFHVLHLF